MYKIIPIPVDDPAPDGELCTPIQASQEIHAAKIFSLRADGSMAATILAITRCIFSEGV